MHRKALIPGRRTALSAALALGCGAALAAVGGLPSNVGHADSSPEWEKLRTALFQQREIATDSGRVKLIVPLRAAYGASVPVKVVSLLPQTPALYVKRLTLLIDKNPSPVAAAFELTPEIGQADLETRLRVDEYSHVRVIAELSNGELHMDSRYVKTSGGCSAPPNRDQLHNIGKMQFKLPEGVKAGAPTPVELTVVHPNDTGFELNNITVMFIPPHFVRSIRASYGGRKLFDADLDFSVSENPSFRFNFVPQGPGELKVEAEDSKEGRFVGTLRVDTGQAAAATATTAAPTAAALRP
ncbi:quinoprotein dehydrogenase-associated SoxYZ-like carrier [Rivibacter subsaxonicus]|uniref:Sulfur-oxidizing protein SoxY n=1 Tax=Rivibacter subsaxonicus TaxID=457575 RepID=A0A4Q7W180_9BURK|nr:quinoprotein dehydrogenase-associated SoxYZ-like carrier [Rivibacter subsaxonicus]RZU02971.1 sulfur-oxidizing protein SoxY [Rivibacter subsaxonicus]